jgi:uncharacterized protein YdaU (DUF1376 family)
MSKGDAGLFVEYCAKDFLDGTNMMDPWEEVAYRRICDLIYSTSNRLKDDDRMLAWATKTGHRWPKIKVALTTGDKPKLEIRGGFVTNKRCTAALGLAAQKIAAAAEAGRASAATGKSLKNLNRSRTAVRQSGEITPPILSNGSSNGASNGSSNGSSNQPPTHLTNCLESPNGLSRVSPAKSGRRELESEFDEIWCLFPRKRDRGHALKEFIAARKHTALDIIEAGLKQFARESEGKDPQFIRYPATWLKGQGWLDEEKIPNGYSPSDSGPSMFETGPTEPPPTFEGFEIRPSRPH